MPRSSTSSSEPTPTSGVSRFALRALAFTALCPLPLLALAVYLQMGGVRSWDVDTQMREHPSYKRHLLATHLDVEVVVLGGSRALTGIDSEVLADELAPVLGHRPEVLNLGLWAYDPRRVRELLGDLLPRLRGLRLVVYSATQRLLVDRPGGPPVPAQSWSLRPSAVQGALLGLFRVNGAPAGAVRFQRFGAVLGQPDRGDIGIGRGSVGRWPAARAVERRLQQQALCPQVENFAALEGMLRDLPASALRVVVTLPTSQAYLDAHHRHAPAARAAYLARLAELPSRVDHTVVLDLSDPVDPELEWFEPDHLFASSRPRLTRQLAAALRAELATGSTATPR